MAQAYRRTWTSPEIRVSGTFGLSLEVSGEMPEDSAFVEFRILDIECRIFFIEQGDNALAVKDMAFGFFGTGYFQNSWVEVKPDDDDELQPAVLSRVC